MDKTTNVEHQLLFNTMILSMLLQYIIQIMHGSEGYTEI